MARNRLGPFEFEVLSAVQQQPVEAYGMAIRRRLQERSGRSVNVGSIYVALERLEHKGFVDSWWDEPRAKRGCRRKRYYRIEANGEAALRRTEEAVRRIIDWDDPASPRRDE